MNTTQFAKDDTAFLERGDEVIYVAQAGSQHVVIPVYEEREDREPEYGEPILVKTVYSEPPVGKRFARIAELDEQIRQAHAALTGIKAETREANKERDALLGRLKQNNALKRIDDFLAGNLTHFVLHGESYVKVLPTAEALKNGNGDNRDGYDRSLKLVSLFGDTKGDLEWRINEYRDGSGSSWKSAVPFTSEEEATAFAVELMSKKLNDPETKLYHARLLIPYANKLGVNVPARITAAINAEDEAESAKRMAGLEAEIVKLQTQIDAKRAAVAVPVLKIAKA
jgi:hypothetical protein